MSQSPAHAPGAAAQAASPTESEIARRNPTVVFVLGPPGAGKGSQCSLLAREYPVAHLSAGELLRTEMADPGSKYRTLIDECIREGVVVPAEVTVKLLRNAILADKEAKIFLIDGFPRALDNYECFRRVLGPYDKFMICLECPEDELVHRIAERSKSSGRTDDNAESLRKRIRVYKESTLKVFEHFEAEGRLRRVDGVGSVEEVHKRFVAVFEGLL